jgi:hypothetical protein
MEKLYVQKLNEYFNVSGDDYLFFNEDSDYISTSNIEPVNVKEYLVRFPNGNIEEIRNLRKFCLRHNLNVGHIHETLYGKRLHHKEYKLVPRTEEEIERYTRTRKIREDSSRKALPGNKNGMFNKKHKTETKEKMLKRKRELFAREYHLISPEGNEVVINTTLREFCRTYGLERKSLTNVINGKARHHKGWTVPQVAQTT